MTSATRSSTDVSSPELVALGEAMFVRAGDVAQSVLERWRRRDAGAAASEDVYRDVVRTTELATVTVGQYLTTGNMPTSGQKRALAATGKAPLRDTISLRELTRLYLYWRDAALVALQEEVARLGLGDDTREYGKVVIQVGLDLALLRMTNEFDDERERLQAELARERARLEHQALHDALTGLPNRLLFVDRLEHALDVAARRMTRCAVLFIDLDRFKNINDAAGHTVGDEVLVEVGRRLEAAVRTSDTVARLGGDEFVVLCEDFVADEYDVEAIVQRVHEMIADPVVVGDQEFFVSASIGIALANASHTADGVLAQADRAMYVAKQRGRARHEFYRLDADRDFERRAELLQALHRAVERDELELHYQPVTALVPHRVTHMEALLRWNHPDRGQIPPGEFIPLAEETGMIDEIGRWVLERACRDCAQWRREGSEVGVTVNISGRQLEDRNLATSIAAILDECEVEPSALTLELTETVLFGDGPHVGETLDELHALGVAIAIDDFGTGYSSLSYLSKFPIDVVKIDRSFVSGLGDAERNATIVFATVELAHALGLTVVAEGVEQESELARLRDARCDAVQGFLLGRPDTLDVVRGFLY